MLDRLLGGGGGLPRVPHEPLEGQGHEPIEPGRDLPDQVAGGGIAVPDPIVRLDEEDPLREGAEDERQRPSLLLGLEDPRTELRRHAAHGLAQTVDLRDRRPPRAEIEPATGDGRRHIGEPSDRHRRPPRHEPDHRHRNESGEHRPAQDRALDGGEVGTKLGLRDREAHDPGRLPGRDRHVEARILQRGAHPPVDAGGAAERGPDLRPSGVALHHRGVLLRVGEDGAVRRDHRDPGIGRRCDRRHRLLEARSGGELEVEDAGLLLQVVDELIHQHAPRPHLDEQPEQGDERHEDHGVPGEQSPGEGDTRRSPGLTHPRTCSRVRGR